MLRAIREIQPAWIVGENVSGLINWNRGMVFDQVQTDLEAEGYEVIPFVLPACGKNAPHKRERIWFIAYNNRYGCDRNKEFTEGQQREAFSKFNPCAGARNNTYNNSEGLSQRIRARIISDAETKNSYQGSKLTRIYTKNYWQEFPVTSPFWCRNDGLSYQLDGITFSKWRNESIKAYGNAIVPQVAFEIFKVIQQLHETTTSKPSPQGPIK
jgi:DNA (cytosine-5)-methyltransferase 1